MPPASTIWVLGSLSVSAWQAGTHAEGRKETPATVRHVCGRPTNASIGLAGHHLPSGTPIRMRPSGSGRQGAGRALLRLSPAEKGDRWTPDSRGAFAHACPAPPPSSPLASPQTPPLVLEGHAVWEGHVVRAAKVGRQSITYQGGAARPATGHKPPPLSADSEGGSHLAGHGPQWRHARTSRTIRIFQNYGAFLESPRKGWGQRLASGPIGRTLSANPLLFLSVQAE
ncbi:hypothetical protein VDGL01_08756 [Verticillium dahliae]